MTNEKTRYKRWRTQTKPIKVDDDTMVMIVGDNKGFRELTAAINPITEKTIQKFGFDVGNEIANSKEELTQKLQKKYGKEYFADGGEVDGYGITHIKSGEEVKGDFASQKEAYRWLNKELVNLEPSDINAYAIEKYDYADGGETK